MELATRSVVVYSIDIRNSCKNIKIPHLLRTRHYILYIDIDGVCDMATRQVFKPDDSMPMGFIIKSTYFQYTICSELLLST